MSLRLLSFEKKSTTQLTDLKCYSNYDKKNHFFFFLQILKVWLLNTWLAKFIALIFIQRLFTLSVSFGFHRLPFALALVVFQTDGLDIRGLDLGKSDVIDSLHVA